MSVIKGNKSYFQFLAFMLMITTFLPIFSAHSRFNIGVNSYWAIIWFISVILFFSRILTNNFFIFVLFYCMIFILLLSKTLWVNVDEWNKIANDETLLFLVPISLHEYYRNSRDFNRLALLIKWTLLFIAITAILSIYSASIDPLYLRKMISSVYTANEAKVFQKFGGGGWGFSSALVILLPIIVYYYRNSSNIPFSKPLILIFGILCFVTLFKMQIFANIILSIFAIIFSLFGSRKIRKSFIYSGILLTLIIILPKNIYSDILNKSSSYFNPESDIYYKLNDLANYIDFGEQIETGTSGRLDRYPLLWDGFKANPILGFYNSDSKMDISLGGHLFWMNKLTVYGILNFIPFILIFYFYIKRTIKLFDPEFAFYFLVSVITGIALGFIKRIGGPEFWYMFFFIIPSLYYLPYLKRKLPLKESKTENGIIS